jgi:hypothetical protein
VPNIAGNFLYVNKLCQVSSLLIEIPNALTSYQLIHVFVSAFGSVLCVIMRMQQIVLILFQRQNFNLRTGNMAVMYKEQIKLTCNCTVKDKYIIP